MVDPGEPPRLPDAPLLVAAAPRGVAPAPAGAARDARVTELEATLAQVGAASGSAVASLRHVSDAQVLWRTEQAEDSARIALEKVCGAARGVAAGGECGGR